MARSNKSEAVAEAVAQADAQLSNAGLTTYTDMVDVLKRLHKVVKFLVNPVPSNPIRIALDKAEAVLAETSKVTLIDAAAEDR